MQYINLCVAFMHSKLKERVGANPNTIARLAESPRYEYINKDVICLFDILSYFY